MSLGPFLSGRPPRPNPAPAVDVEALVRAAAVGMGQPPRPRLWEALAVVAGEDLPWRAPPGYRVRIVSGEIVAYPAPVFVEGRVTPVAGERYRARLVVTDPREAWEAFGARGLIPMAWVGDPSRQYVRPRTGPFSWVAGREAWPTPEGQVVVRGWNASSLQPPSRFEVPPEPLDLVMFDRDPRLGSTGQFRPGFTRDPAPLDLALALAADAENLLRAEAVVTELVTRLAPWLDGEEAGRPVRWGWGLVGLTDQDASFPPNLTGGAIAEAHGLAYFQTKDSRGRDLALRRASRLVGERYPLHYAAQAHVCWQRAAQAEQRIQNGGPVGRTPRSLHGRSFAEVPNPFEPLLALGALGYATFDTEGPNLCLAVPTLAVPTPDRNR